MKPQLRTGTWRRIIWFGLINLTIVLTIMFLTQGELNELIPFLIIYASVMPFISLTFSKRSVKKAYNLQMVEADGQYEDEIEWYRQTVVTICQRAGMERMPEIGIYESDDKNAFATGRSKNSSLVAVSTGLLYDMSAEAVEAVIAHEVAHIMNGDMVTQTLLQSALNMIVSVILLPIAIYKWIALFSTNRDSVIVYYIILFVEFIVGAIMFFVSSLLLNKFSRSREFKADHLAAMLTRPENMIQALRELDGPAIVENEHKKYASIQFNGAGRLMDLFSTHPSINRRIKYLEKQFYE